MGRLNYTATRLQYHIVDTLTCYYHQSHYTDTGASSPFQILIQKDPIIIITIIYLFILFFLRQTLMTQNNQKLAEVVNSSVR